jgi:Zn-dependent protease with chaperone function
MIFLASPSDYLGFFEDYFSTAFIALALMFVGSSIAGLFVGFKNSRSSARRSELLVAMMALSSSLWIFVISSLVLCTMFVREYWVAPFATILFVSESGFLISLLAGPLAFLALRGHAVRLVANSLLDSVRSILDAENKIESRILRIFSRSVRNAELGSSVKLALLRSDSKLPVSTAFDYKGTRIVAVRENLVDILDDQELEAVFAHEIGHIKCGDSFKKTLVTTFKMAFPFDPLIRFIEAAFYREREYAADEFSGRHTREPAALASALMKIYEILTLRAILPSTSISSLSISSASGLLSKQPPLESRVRRLLKLSEIV